MIIIEGPDGSGKSTLVSLLVKSLPNMHVIHSPGPAQTQGELFERLNDTLHIGFRTRTLLDRISCISEQVYGPVLRDRNFMEGTDFLANIIKSGVLIIYCRAPTETILNNHHPRIEEDASHIAEVRVNLRKIAEKYDDFMSIVPHIKYDWTSTSPNCQTMMIDFIKLYLRNMVGEDNERR